MKWIIFNKDIPETYPPEGVDVLVCSGLDDVGNISYDVAWYLMSSEYVWMKTDIEADDSKEFTAFVPVSWKFIDDQNLEATIWRI